MYDELVQLDAKAAERYADKNPRRVLRALEYIRQTGNPFSSLWEATHRSANVDAAYFAIQWDRQVLYDRINTRCDHMWNNGIFEETQRALDTPVDRYAQSLRTVGYKEVCEVLLDGRDSDEALEAFKMSSRRYAKRQMTWFKADERYLWFDGDEGAETIASKIYDHIRTLRSFATIRRLAVQQQTRGYLAVIRRTLPFIGVFLVVVALNAQDTTKLPSYSAPFPSQFDSTQAVKSLTKRLNSLFNTRAYRRSKESIQVYSITRGVTLYEKSPELALTPASNTKLFSTNAAFYALRNDGMLKTEIRATGQLMPDGTLEGDLYIVGRGDALLTVNDIEEMADKLFAIGLRRVHGTIYGDPSFFDNQTNRAIYSGDGEDVQRLAPITALSHSMGKIAIVVSATSKGYISAQTIPQSDAIVLKRLTKRRKGRRRIRVTSTVDNNGKQIISVSGSPGANRTKTVYVDMRSPALNLAGALSNRLRSGGIMNDTLIGVQAAPENARVLTSFSRPFVEMASVVNKRSHNYLAEHVFKLVGGLYGGQTSTAAKAKEMILSTLDSMGVYRKGAMFNDGSGLSRRNLVCARTVVELLTKIRSMPYSEDFYNCLSIAAVDGTLRGRMHNTPADSNMCGKTGTLRSVSSLSGYVTTRDGELLAFSVISNGPYKRNFKATENQVAIELASFSYRSSPAATKKK